MTRRADPTASAAILALEALQAASEFELAGPTVPRALEAYEAAARLFLEAACLAEQAETELRAQIARATCPPAHLCRGCGGYPVRYRGDQCAACLGYSPSPVLAFRRKGQAR